MIFCSIRKNEYICIGIFINVNMGVKEKIAKAILERKEAMGVSRYALAREANVSYNQIMAIEKTGATSIRTIEKLFDILGLDIEVVEKGNN